MINIDATIPCPYCNCPSALYAYRNMGFIEHRCPACGYRKVPMEQVVFGWARAEACRAAFGDQCPQVEPLRRGKDGAWTGRWTGRAVELAPVPEDACDRFSSEVDEWR